jgi:hypothetical protein
MLAHMPHRLVWREDEQRVGWLIECSAHPGVQACLPGPPLSWEAMMAGLCTC